MKDLRETVERAFADVSTITSQWAAVGGLAVSTYVEPRATRDVDLAVVVPDDNAAEQIVRSMMSLGYFVEAAVERTDRSRLATVRMRASFPSAAIVDLLFDTAGIEAEVVADAVVLEILPGLRAPVATVGHLIAMKVLARDDRNRPRDWDDLRALLEAADAKEIERARAAVAQIEARGYARGKDLGVELEALIREHTSN